MTQLVVFRVIQGAGGGMMVPVGMAMLYRVFPPAERIRAASIITVRRRSLQPSDRCWAGSWSRTSRGAGSSSSTCRSASPR